MLIIKIVSLPAPHPGDLNESTLHRDLIEASLKVEDVGIEDRHRIICLFPIDPLSPPVEEIVIEMQFLDRLERHQQVRDKLQSEVTQIVSSRFPRARVRCVVEPPYTH